MAFDLIDSEVTVELVYKSRANQTYETVKFRRGKTKQPTVQKMGLLHHMNNNNNVLIYHFYNYTKWVEHW